jgi:hypothetical protein
MNRVSTSPVCSIMFLSTVSTMAEMRNFEVVLDRFNVDWICMSVIYGTMREECDIYICRQYKFLSYDHLHKIRGH